MKILKILLENLQKVSYKNFHRTKQKKKFSIKDFFRKQRISSHLLKKSFSESFIFCAVCKVLFYFLNLSQVLWAWL